MLLRETGFCCHCQGRLGHSTMRFSLVGSPLTLWCNLGVQWTPEGQTFWGCNPLKPTLKITFSI